MNFKVKLTILSPAALRDIPLNERSFSEPIVPEKVVLISNQKPTYLQKFLASLLCRYLN